MPERFVTGGRPRRVDAPRSWWWAVLTVFWGIWMTGCMAKPEPPPSSAAMSASAPRYRGAADSDLGYAMEEASMAEPPRRPAPSPRAAAGAEADSGGGTPAPAPSATRKIHYSGYAQLRVQSVEETTDALTRTAESLGGFVESVTGRVVTLRVPVDQFESAFEQMVSLGDLMQRSISARDVTDAFTAVDLRLATARKTRDRLVELLARAEDEQEKLALIQQIQRVSEQIDRLEAQLRTLDSLANMSRITLELVEREAQAWRDQGAETAEMTWISELSPFEPDLVSAGRKLALPVPEGMVQLTPARQFVAEGPDGSRIWSGRLRNEPNGDGVFWTDAIRTRIGAEFAAVEVETLGGFTLLKLTDRGEAPYTWWIAVRPRGQWLDLVEVYFPTPAELERFEAAVRASLAGAGGAA